MGYSFEPRERKRDNPEGRLVLEIIKYLRWKGHYAAKLKVKGGFKAGGGFIKDLYACVGLPDIIAFVPHLLFIEAKSKTGVQSDRQKEFETRCKTANIPYLLIRDLSEIEKIIF